MICRTKLSSSDQPAIRAWPCHRRDILLPSALLRRRSSAHITADAVALFRRGMLERDPYKLREIKIQLAAALGRSKFAANPLDPRPRSLIGCDTEPPQVSIGIRAELMKRAVTKIPALL